MQLNALGSVEANVVFDGVAVFDTLEANANDSIFVNAGASIQTTGTNSTGNVTLVADADQSAQDPEDGQIVFGDGAEIIAAGGEVLDGEVIGRGFRLFAESGISISENVTVTETGLVVLNADSDADGIGTFGIASAVTFDSGTNDIEITAADVELLGSLVADGQTIAIRRSTVGTIGLGDGAGGDLQIDQAELAAISAGSLVLGDAGGAENSTTAVLVSNADATTSTISGLVQLNALADENADVSFAGLGLSTFNAVEANASDSVLVGDGATIQTLAGNLSLNANVDLVAGDSGDVYPALGFHTELC